MSEFNEIFLTDLGGQAKSTDVVQKIIDYILQADVRAW